MYDLLIRGGHLLTMTGEGVGFVEHGAVAIQGREIVAVGSGTGDRGGRSSGSDHRRHWLPGHART